MNLRWLAPAVPLLFLAACSRQSDRSAPVALSPTTAPGEPYGAEFKPAFSPTVASPIANDELRVTAQAENIGPPKKEEALPVTPPPLNVPLNSVNQQNQTKKNSNSSNTNQRGGALPPSPLPPPTNNSNKLETAEGDNRKTTSTVARSVVARDQASFQTVVATGNCDRMCDALHSLERSTTRLCSLEPLLCSSETATAERARAVVEARCGEALCPKK